MKKLLIILPLLIIMTACSMKPASVRKDFMAVVISEYNGVKLKAEIISDGHDMMTCEMKSPENLKGYTYKFKSSNVKLSYNGLVLKSDIDYLNQKDFACVIYSVLRAINHGEENYVGAYKNKAQYEGKCSSGKFALTCDVETGYISNIEIRQLDFSADFKIS